MKDKKKNLFRNFIKQSVLYQLFINMVDAFYHDVFKQKRQDPRKVKNNSELSFSDGLILVASGAMATLAFFVVIIFLSTLFNMVVSAK